jgi:L-fucose/D-arabinose isomerase
MKSQTIWKNLPKVGIRPTIDGRLGGVRESLEEQTMKQAQAVASLIEETLRYPNGESVQCVIADTCIGGVAEAAQAADQFSREGVGVSLTVTPCWCYGSETMDMDPLTPKAIWGFNGTERPGAVYLAAVSAAHAQKGIPAYKIYGEDVQDSTDNSIPADVQGKIFRFIRTGLAVSIMRGKSYLSMGGTSMGIVGSTVDPAFFESYLGMRVEFTDMSEFTRRLNADLFDNEEYTRAKEYVKTNFIEGADFNDQENQRNRSQLDQEWETSIKMCLIARDLMVGNPRLAEKGWGEEAQGHHAIAAGFQGQRQWTDHMPNGDLMEAVLNSSWDWNGKRAPYILATENDALNGVCMLFGHLLTHTAQVFADLRTFWSSKAVERVSGKKLTGLAENGILHLINSGPAALDGTGEQSDSHGQPTMKPYWEISDDEVAACNQSTTWHPSITEYFPGGGWSTRYQTKGGMPVTMTRLNVVKGLGPALQLVEGYTVELDEDVHEALDHRTNPTWPTTWFAPRLTGTGAFRSVYSVMDAWGSNHCVMTPGHVGADFISLAANLRIPVYMHNLEESQVFRPSSWTAFGTSDSEGADFRACEKLGPLYTAYK